MTVPTAGHPAPVTPGGRPFRLLWLSIAAALVTISLKTAAWLLTGSVGLLSDAAESLVNLVAAVIALAALTWAARARLQASGARIINPTSKKTGRPTRKAAVSTAQGA